MEIKTASNGIRHFNTLLATTTLGLVMIPLTAQAQTQAETSQSEPVEVGEVAIDALEPDYKAEPNAPKYVAPLIDTPRSVTVVTEEVLQETGATSLADALRTTDAGGGFHAPSTPPTVVQLSALASPSMKWWRRRGGLELWRPAACPQ